MKKKICCGLFMCIGLGLVTACGRIDRTNEGATTTSVVEKSSEIQKTTVKEETTTEEKTAVEENTTAKEKETEAEKYDSSDGLPPVNQQMKQFYKEAEEVYLDVVFFRIKCDTQQSKTEETDDSDVKALYYKVADEQYSTMEKIKQALGKYFTKQFTEDLLSAKMWGQPRFKEYDGELYMIQAQRSGNIQYAGHVFETVEYGVDTIKMPVKVYYAIYATPYEYFYEYPKDEAAYEVKEYTQIMTKEDGEWKFSQFELFY